MKGKRYTNQERKEIIKDYHNGMSYPEIQKKWGVSRATFYKWVKRTRMVRPDTTEIQKLRLENEKLRNLILSKTLEEHGIRTQHNGHRISR